MTRQDILKSIKEKFFGEPVAPVAPVAAASPAPVAPAAPAAPAGKVYKLADGSEISITQAGEVPAVGDTVTVAGAPAPAGDYMLEDKSYLVVAEGGVISEVKTAEPVSVDLTNVPPAVPVVAPVAASAFEMPKDIEGLNKLFSTFGSSEERISNLEIVVKALMEYNFGYRIAEANTNKAIIAYEEGIKNAQLSLSKQDLAIKGLFEYVEQIAEAPTATPATLTGHKKERFDKQKQKDEKFASILESIPSLNKTNKY